MPKITKKNHSGTVIDDAKWFVENPDRRYRLRICNRAVCAWDALAYQQSVLEPLSHTDEERYAEWVSMALAVRKRFDGNLETRLVAIRNPAQWPNHECDEVEARAMWMLGTRIRGE